MPTAFAISPTLTASYPLVENSSRDFSRMRCLVSSIFLCLSLTNICWFYYNQKSFHCQEVSKTMEIKSCPQPSGIHDRFNTLHRLASPVMFRGDQDPPRMRVASYSTSLRLFTTNPIKSILRSGKKVKGFAAERVRAASSAEKLASINIPVFS